MARRKTIRPLNDLMDFVSLLPWWAGVGLALVSYLVIGQLAASWGQPVDTAQAGKPGYLAFLLQGSVIGMLATVGKYLLPFAFLVGAALSAWRHRQRQALADEAAQAPAAAGVLDSLPWQEFEALLAEAYRLQGFEVAKTGEGGADGGKHMVLTRDGETFLVECKEWRALKVGVDTVRDLLGVIAVRGAAGGFVVTSGRFTNDAKRFTQGRDIQLVDGSRLLGMLKLAQQSRLAAAAVIAAHGGVHAELPVAPPAAPVARASTTLAAAQGAQQPGCPQCGCCMVRRIARTGNNAGRTFWGCPGFPACRGVRQVD